jgi:hypothetical protein
MKKKKVVLTMVAMIVVSAFAFATAPTSKVAVVNQNNSVYKLIYEGATAGKVMLKIYDNSSNVIFTETKKGLSKFILPLNFAGLEQGEYSIEITDETGTQIQKVNHKVIENTKTSAASKSVHITKLQDGKYLMSANSTCNFNLQIFDGNENLIHSKNFDVNGNFAIVYSLQNVEGQPSFLVK